MNVSIEKKARSACHKLCLAFSCIASSVSCDKHETLSETTGAPPAHSNRAAAAGLVPSAPPRAGDGRALCSTLCARSAPLNCKGQPDCEGRCEEMLALPVCAAPLRAALECFASVPMQQWECDEDGTPSVKEGQCDAEQARMAECLQSKQ